MRRRLPLPSALKPIGMADAAADFVAYFVAELRAEGRSSAEIARYIWKPYALDDLKILGAGRDGGGRIEIQNVRLRRADERPLVE